MSSQKTGPIAGLKVLDLTHVMAGPTCTLLLADLGADVVKVERPPLGDDSRHMAPPYVGDQSAAYLMMNRNKRGIVLDLKTDGGREALRRLAATSDVVVENFRAGALDKLGLGYDALSAENPGLIWCAISGYGRSGPYAARGGFDLMAQAMSGIMSFTGEAAGRPPVKVGAPVADITAGVLAALGILAALNHRNATGQGQIVESSLFEAAVMHTFWQSAMTFATGESPGPMGSAHPLDGPYQAFETANGWIVVGAANQANWLRLLKAIERPDLGEDPRFGSNPDRMRNLSTLVALLEPVFAAKDSKTWLETLDAAGVPCAPVLSTAEMHRDPQAIARQMIASVEHTALGSVKTLGSPIKLSQTPVSLGNGAPLLGEHTREVLSELSYTAAEIDALVAAGTAGAPADEAAQ
ncbi:MAG: CaiB/BaiF CoA-transferase family protein [Pseudomonadota bacterium]